MRKVIYILVCGLLFSCSNVNNKEMILESTADVVEESEAPMIASETFQHETMTKQKLQELLDLKGLAEAYPEDAAIKNQLALITHSVDLANLKGSQKVVSMAALSEPKQVNDSVQHLSLVFTTEDVKGQKIKNSFTAVITSRVYALDGDEHTGTKIVFKN